MYLVEAIIDKKIDSATSNLKSNADKSLYLVKW